MDENGINSILFQVLRGVNKWGEQGEATKKALILAMEAAAKMGQPNQKAAMERLEPEAGATEDPRKEAARLAGIIRHCYDMMAGQVVVIKGIIEQGHAAKEMAETARKIDGWAGHLKTAGTALTRLDLSGCPPDMRADLRGAHQSLKTAARWLTDIEAIMFSKIQEMEPRDPAARTNAEPRPCRMASHGCKENHKMRKCGVFNRMSAEHRMVVAQ